MKRTLGPGWAHAPKGFTFQHGGVEYQAHCQTIPDGWGTGTACGNRARYARTIWDGGVLFSCGRHIDRMEEFAAPLIAMGSRGAVVMRPIIEAPFWSSVPGAAEPVEHPVHFPCTEAPDGMMACWCGATRPASGNTGRAVWTGGKPEDTPWWERKPGPGEAEAALAD